MPETAAWHEEDVERITDDGDAFVFRWVPDFAPIGGRRKEHPTFAEWLSDMAAAADGLDGPSPAVRMHYDLRKFGVEGHRKATEAEIEERVHALRKQATYVARMIARFGGDDA